MIIITSLVERAGALLIRRSPDKVFCGIKSTKKPSSPENFLILGA